ncbi:3'-5' exonuclease [Clostridium sp. YIM B02551]|uniref:3'-5' exonuclease n=1 Tax=Clostridium sp. YIM B02551 TaxID=2910679 RepID=UPI001EEA628F|nr:3'-5' exonuclease [Clostridium sp. YIM B02551]
MNYIIFDLEFNQGYKYAKKDDSPINPSCPFEIIQIGAVKLNSEFNIISSYNRLVKPQIYKNLHSFIKEMTSLTIEELNNSKNFNEVYLEFVDFIGKDENILCVWGTADIRELFRNIYFFHLDDSLISKEYIDIQHYASKYFNCPKGTNIGLNNATTLLDIPIINQFHDAYNDACYTVQVFTKIYTENIVSKKYSKNTNVKRKNTKSKIDTYHLIEQFEKMYNRKMTKEEKGIIKLAYLMGKTNQFQIKN